tara:strand:- start:116 stop:436 length:321 start_codon:yes stop_codon:yes gene_type:complete
VAELAPFASQDRLEDIQVKILNSVDLLKRLRRYRNLRLAHFDSELMEDVSIPPEDVNTIVEETKQIFNLLKFSHFGEYDKFDDIMEDVSLHTSEVISLMSINDNNG